MLFFSGMVCYSSPTNKDIELTKVSSQIKQLQKTILLDKQRQEGLQQELEKIEVTIGALGEQVHSLNQLIEKEEHQLDQLKSKQNFAQARLNQQQIALNQQIRATYQLKEVHPLKIILNQSNPNAIQRYLTYYKYLTQSRVALIQSIQDSLLLLKTNMKEIVKHQANLKKLLTEKQLQQKHEQQAQNQRQELLTNYKESVQSKEQQLAILLSNQQALYDIISKLQTREETQLPVISFNQLQGKLHWPVPGQMIATYGSLLDVGEQHLNGVVIKANQDTPVKAIYAGKVIFANWLRGFGLLIIIHHNNNFMSLYGRNHTLLTHAGAEVHTGEIIATTGNSGGFDKPGLYFEIREHGTPVNPNIWCR